MISREREKKKREILYKILHMLQERASRHILNFASEAFHREDEPPRGYNIYNQVVEEDEFTERGGKEISLFFFLSKG